MYDPTCQLRGQEGTTQSGSSLTPVWIQSVSSTSVSVPSAIGLPWESTRLRAGGGCLGGWDPPRTSPAPTAGQATTPKSSPRTPDARSGRPSFGHSSPASGSWSAGPSGSPAPWCSPGGGGTGCPGSALARWKLSAHAHRRETALGLRLRTPFPLLLPRTQLALHIHQQIPRDLGAACTYLMGLLFPASQTGYVCLTRISGVG